MINIIREIISKKLYGKYEVGELVAELSGFKKNCTSKDISVRRECYNLQKELTKQIILLNELITLENGKYMIDLTDFNNSEFIRRYIKCCKYLLTKVFRCFIAHYGYGEDEYEEFLEIDDVFNEFLLISVDCILKNFNIDITISDYNKYITKENIAILLDIIDPEYDYLFYINDTQYINWVELINNVYVLDENDVERSYDDMIDMYDFAIETSNTTSDGLEQFIEDLNN